MSRPDELVCPLTPRLKSLMDSLRSDLTAIGTDEAHTKRREDAWAAFSFQMKYRSTHTEWHLV